jgi:phosphatidylserine/phosphatidylglycerophosphate/cardiolipin synthase-like enzyme/DNA/RNA endonuclease YhcR with UshA esterase domain
MKQLILISLLLVLGIDLAYNQIDISAARTQVGSSVTIRGIAINGDEIGRIKYIQDATGAIAAYSSTLDNLQAGSDVTITGVVKNYNNLLELDPVSSFTVHSTGNPLPIPVVLNPDQLGEAYEAQLIQINNAVFKDAGQVFAANTNYNFTSGGEDGVIRISDFNGSNPNVGEIIPSGEVTITGILSQYFSTYQILVRYVSDVLPEGAININSSIELSNLTSSGFTLNWNTDVAGTTEAFYGNSPDLELGAISEANSTSSHSLEISGASPSELFYIQPFSVLGTDTTRAATGVYVTESESTGEIKAYFNRQPDNSVSTGTNAIFLDQAIDDTLINYINRAKYSIDFSIYNFNNSGISNISNALNSAHDRGITVRVVYDSNTDNNGIQSLNTAIGKISSPESFYPVYGIMHNKFIVFDAQSTDANDPIVWTGSTNFTDGQINTDPNNVIIIQDKSLAIAYQLEFNEMFGSSGPTPDPIESRFGPDKTDNTPHEFIIDGKRVECYFSPSDGTNGKIVEAIEQADNDLSIATMLITRDDISYAITDAVSAGVETKVLVNVKENCDVDVLDRLKTSLIQHLKESGESGIMHNKYMVIDQGNTSSDPMVLTGCHNWSTAAEVRNDENTLIIHDATLANIYYQDFLARFANGLLIIDAPKCSKDFITMDNGTSKNFPIVNNDDIPSTYNLEISRQPTNGSAFLENDNTITYTPDPGFNSKLDTVYYKVCLTINTSLCDSSYAVVFVNLPTGINEFLDNKINVYPNPTTNLLNISFESKVATKGRLQITDIKGKTMLEMNDLSFEQTLSVPVENLAEGIYFMRLISDEGIINRKFVIKR